MVRIFLTVKSPFKFFSIFVTYIILSPAQMVCIVGGIGLILASEPQNKSWVAQVGLIPIETSGGDVGNLTAHATCIKLVSYRDDKIV